MSENFTEGLIIISIAASVVLLIILLLIVFIECIIAYDQFLRRRAQKAKPAPETSEAQVSGDVVDDRIGDGVVAAISLALHEHFAGSYIVENMAVEKGAGPSVWASSGRLEMMASRQNITGRNRGINQ